MRIILPWIPILLLLLIVFFASNMARRKSHSVIQYVLIGGILFGLVGLFGGMFAAVIIAPHNNLLPIIGIFYTGPAGFILGMIAGWWYSRKRTTAINKQ